MDIQLIRNATLRINYAGKQFVIDPYLAAKHSLPSYTGASPNPLVELPIPAEEVIAGAEMAVVSHLHSDHFDSEAARLLPKELEVFCQPGDEAQIEGKGFRNVRAVEDELEWKGIRILRTEGQHGSGSVLADMGQVSGFVFEAEGEPTVYWVGDSIWYPAVAKVIEQFQPEIIITHSCGAMWGEQVLIVMDAAQTVEACRAAPKSVVVATHMEALDHATVSRKALRDYAEAAGIGADQLLIPDDGVQFGGAKLTRRKRRLGKA
jgi:L-ascorbate metabolism protein UlaG (beta-lactamase superfamily)